MPAVLSTSRPVARGAMAIALAAAMLGVDAAPPDAPTRRGVEIATAIAGLVAAGQETSLAGIGDALHLPELATQARFDGPRGRFGGAFRADYEVPESALGIMDVHVEWLLVHETSLRTELRVLIEAPACPTREELTRLTRGHVFEFRFARPSPYELMLDVPSGREDEAVLVRRIEVPFGSVDDKKTCTLYIDRRPAGMPLVQPLD